MLAPTFVMILVYMGGCLSFNIPWIQSDANRMPCGLVKLRNNTVTEGLNNIESYPWLGLLIYPIDGGSPTTTTVVLISRQIALSSALDIDYYPKQDFRTRSRVILGNNCSGPYIRVRDYTFHPDFTRTTYSAMAVVQLDTIRFKITVFPICPPSNADVGEELEIYAMGLVHDCYNSSMVMVYKMQYVDTTHCRDYYRILGLDIESMWPTHLVCARALEGDHCIWRSGTALVMRDDGRWRLLGLGTYGPGCGTPARFLDYGMYHLWVRRTIAKIGRPAITRISNNQIILRRTMKNIPRYGLCDPEEVKQEIHTDKTTIVPPYDYDFHYVNTMKYNVTLLDSVEYSCIVLQAWNEFSEMGKPFISLRRWCTNPNKRICLEYTNVSYYVQINFWHTCTFKVTAYGTDMNKTEQIETTSIGYEKK